MKKVFLLFAVIFCLVACAPEPDEPAPVEPIPVDYRLKYVGDYAYTIDYWAYSAGAYPNPMYRDTTWYYSGTINLMDDSLGNRVLVHWGDDASTGYSPHLSQTNKMIVDTAGVLSYPEYCNSDQRKFTDAFIRNDTIRWKFTDGGAGSSKSWTVMGVKED